MSSTYNPAGAAFTTIAAPRNASTKAPSLWAFIQAIGAARGRKTMLELAESTAQSRPELSARLRRAAQDDWS